MGQLNPQGYGRGLGILGGYSLLVAVYQALFGAFLLETRRRGMRLPRSIEARDFLLLGVATYKLSRLISKDSVTSFIRAPFTVYREPQGDSEVKEDVRGSGVQKAIGELLTCPFCVGTWIAALLAYGFVLETRLTRFTASIFAIAAIADAFQYGFEALRKATEDKEQ